MIARWRGYVAACLFLSVFGCGSPEQTVEHSVEWYVAHDAERTSMLTRCRGSGTRDVECQNASQAARLRALKRTRQHDF